MYTAPHTGSAAEMPGNLRGAWAYTELKRRLLQGEFALGERLGEERLAGTLGVSRTPVREALSRLHTEGFVARLRDGGFGPVAPDLHVVRELYEVRRGLELLALRRPLEGGPPHDRAVLEALIEDWRSMEPPESTVRSAGPTDDDETAVPDPSFVLLDEDFHERLASAAGNAELVTLLHGVNERIRIVRIHDFLTVERIEATIAQHLAIVEAAVTGAEAAVALDAHLSESLAVVEQRAATALARMVATRLGGTAGRTRSSRSTPPSPAVPEGGPR